MKFIKIFAPLSVIIVTLGFIVFGLWDKQNKAEQLEYYSQYVGSWSNGDIDWAYGGEVLTIEINDDIMWVSYKNQQGAGQDRLAWINQEVSIYDIKDNQLSLSFDNDGWGNAGTISLDFSKDKINVDVGISQYATLPVWGVVEGTTALTRNDNANEQLKYTLSDYYQRFSEYENVLSVFIDSFLSGDVETFWQCFYFTDPLLALTTEEQAEFEQVKQTTNQSIKALSKEINAVTGGQWSYDYTYNDVVVYTAENEESYDYLYDAINTSVGEVLCSRILDGTEALVQLDAEISVYYSGLTESMPLRLGLILLNGEWQVLYLE